LACLCRQHKQTHRKARHSVSCLTPTCLHGARGVGCCCQPHPNMRCCPAPLLLLTKVLPPELQLPFYGKAADRGPGSSCSCCCCCNTLPVCDAQRSGRTWLRRNLGSICSTEQQQQQQQQAKHTQQSVTRKRCLVHTAMVECICCRQTCLRRPASCPCCLWLLLLPHFLTPGAVPVA
jgi:hypothetical protein